MDRLRDYFDLDRLGTTVRTEAVAGLTTFMTMAYIIFVNPVILSAAGLPLEGAAVATCVVSGALTLAMGLASNYPLTLAPGMGLNAVVAYTIVVGMGQPWTVAMGIIVAEGILITILVLTNLRERVMEAIPMSLKHAIGVGIGLFIAFIGLVEGGLVTAHPATLVSLGDLTQPHALAAALGLVLTAVLVARRVRGAILFGILGTLILAVLFQLQGWPKDWVSLPRDFSTFFQFDLLGALKLSLIPMIFALFMSDFFDTMGTVIGVTGEAGLLDERGRLPRLKSVLLVDSLAAVAGGAVGASSATTYIESAAGVSEGGRSGLTAVVTGLLFFFALFFTPLVSIVAGGIQVAPGVVRHPVTAPALVVVGFLMMAVIQRIDFRNYEEGLPAFLVILVMPLTYSISHGIGAGLVSYVLIKLLVGKAREIHPFLYPIAALFALSFVAT